MLVLPNFYYVNKNFKFFYFLKKMASKLAAVLNQAIKTFSILRDTTYNLSDCPHFQTLVSLVNNLQFIDIHREPDLISTCEFAMKSSNPLEYLPLYEDSRVTIGVFILKQNEKIPLHDHPGMHGMLKVLSGELEINSFNMPPVRPENVNPQSEYFYQGNIDVTKNDRVTANSRDKCCVLTPTIGNVHEVVCTRGPSAFLDILAPPYGNTRKSYSPRACHYFEEINMGGGAVRLRQIPNPPGF